MSATVEDEDERDHAQATIDWLADKDPDVRFEVAPNLNWDSAYRVLDWIVSQPGCDRANAAAVFWGADPLYHLRRTRREILVLWIQHKVPNSSMSSLPGLTRQSSGRP
jgi:hypothetical protein